LRRGKGIEDIIREECENRKVSEEEVRKGSRRRRGREVRAVIAFRSKEELGNSGAEIARYLGVNTSSINRAPTRMGHLPPK
jgi:chromosomal replication initiation ATPase DnaA